MSGLRKAYGVLLFGLVLGAGAGAGATTVTTAESQAALCRNGTRCVEVDGARERFASKRDICDSEDHGRRDDT